MGKGSNTTTSTSSTGPDAQAGALYRQILQQAQGVAATPYQAYSGELTAPVNAQQTLGINNINANAGFAQPYIQQAAQYANNAAQPLTAAQIAQYQNPYTQSVVQATQNQFNQQNAQQQQQVTGNAALQGALGGDRVGVAQALTAGQQQMAQAPVLANLNAQGYQQGVQTALSQQQQQAQAAYSLGSLGVAGQNASLTGAGAQIGAGTLQQGTQQAQDTALYNQFLQQQAYPFQTAQWLAGVGTGVGSQLGGTSTGTTTGSPPNQATQYAGLGLAAAGLFLNKGGRIPGFAVGGSPWGDASGYVPSLNITPGKGAPGGGAPNLSSQPQTDPMKLASGATDFAKKLRGGFGFGDDPTDLSGEGVSNTSAYGDVGDSTGLGNLGGTVGDLGTEFGAIFAKGGVVPHYDDGGNVPASFDDRWSGGPDTPPPPPAQPLDALASYKAFPTDQPPSPGFGPVASAPAPSTVQPAQDAYSPASFTDNTPTPSAGFTPSSDTAPAPVTSPDAPQAGGSAPRGIRNNNPGNIEDGPFARSQPGYAGSDGRFAIFKTPDAGAAAAGSLLQSYGNKGINTISGIINRWAPAADGNNTRAYIDAVSRATGIDPNKPIDLNDPTVNRKIAAAIGQYENGTGGLPRDIMEARNYNRAAGAQAGVADDNGALPPGATPTEHKKSGFGLANVAGLSDDTKMALLSAGVGMIGSRSPYLGVGVGEGLQTGLNTYVGQKAVAAKQNLEQSKLDLEARKLSQSADTSAKHLQLQTEQLKQSGEQHKATLAEQMRQHNLSLRTPVKVGQTRGGQDLYALPKPNADGTGVDYYLIDPKTQQVSPTPMGNQNPLLAPPGGGQPQNGQQPNASGVGFQPAQYTPTAEDQATQTVQARAGAPEGSSQARSEEYLADIAKDDPRYAADIKAIANYQMSPAQFSLRNNRREKAMGDVMLYDPTYDQRRYNQTNRAITGWAQSPEGRSTRALSVTVEHLGTAEELGKALDNGNFQALNSLKNTIKTQFGYDGPPNFEFAKQIVSDEIAKAVIGGTNAEKDRQGLQAQLKAASSPAQLEGVIKTAKTLMAGQVIGLKHTYETATGLHNFDDWLTPRARLEVSRELADRDAKLRAQSVGGQQQPQQSAPAGLPPVDQREVGKVYTLNNKSMKWNGKGWDPP